MPDYDVHMKLEDEAYAIHLEVYQRVSCKDEESPETIVGQAKAQFWNWAIARGPEWSRIAMRIPFLTISESNVLPAGGAVRTAETAG